MSKAKRMKTLTERDVKRAENTAAVARQRWMEMRERLDEQTVGPRRRSLIGKCFKYKNCYSCPEKPNDYWWLYARVDAVDGWCLIGPSFQRDKNGKVEFESFGRVASDGAVPSGYVEISRAEFEQAAREILIECAKRVGVREVPAKRRAKRGK